MFDHKIFLEVMFCLLRISSHKTPWREWQQLYQRKTWFTWNAISDQRISVKQIKTSGLEFN